MPLPRHLTVIYHERVQRHGSKPQKRPFRHCESYVLRREEGIPRAALCCHGKGPGASTVACVIEDGFVNGILRVGDTQPDTTFLDANRLNAVETIHEDWPSPKNSLKEVFLWFAEAPVPRGTSRDGRRPTSYKDPIRITIFLCLSLTPARIKYPTIGQSRVSSITLTSPLGRSPSQRRLSFSTTRH